MNDASSILVDGHEYPPAPPLPSGWLRRYPAATFVLPMIVFMVLGTFEPKPPEKSDTAAEVSLPGEPPGVVEPIEPDSPGLLPTFRYEQYPLVYTVKIALVICSMMLVWRGYRSFEWKVSALSVAVGVVGVVIWIGLCHLRLEPQIIGPIDRFLGSLIPGLEPGDTPSVGLMGMLGTGERSAFNPLKEMSDQKAWAWTFLLIRFVGLALVVPVIEEFFLRGFLMRFIMHQQWWQVPFGVADVAALVVGTAVPMLMHPGELFAALAWFSLVSWLMLRTKNIWDCVVAHAVTNFLLGVYVVLFDQWQLM